MGAFSDMNMGFTDGTGSPFEDEGAFGETPEFEQRKWSCLFRRLAVEELMTIQTVNRKKPRRIVLERWWRP